MSKAAAVQPSSALGRWWLKWRFHINILLLLVPLAFMPKYFADASLFRGDSGLGEREIGTVQVGPWSLQLAELRNEAPRPDGPAGYMKSFNAALCKTCIDEVKATYLRIGKPRSLRAAGVIFFGLVLSMMVLSGLLIWTKRTALATANALKRSNKPARAPVKTQTVTARSAQPEEANV